MNGLTEELQLALAVHDFRNFQHLVNKAILVQGKSKALEEARKRKRAAQISASSGFPRPRMWQSHPPRVQAPTPPRPPIFAPRPPPPNWQPRVSGNHPSNVSNVKPGVICYHCGRPRHFANQCWAKARGLPPVRPSSSPVCPAPPPKLPVKSNPTQARGRVNQITAEATIDAPDIVLGMLLVNFKLATILFDSEASHSFIKRHFVVLHQLNMHTLQPPHLIQSSGSVFQTNQICWDIKVEIQGVEFLVNLIVIDLEGLDVILGMDWLSKNHGQINCAQQSISVTSKNGKQVVFDSKIIGSHLYALKVGTTPTLEMVPVVCEYPDIFPKELLGMHPDREVKFAIELAPGTAPISK